MISNRDDEFSIDAVALNNQKPGILMARHLLELGHRDVAFIAPPLTARQHQRQKRVGGFLMEFEKRDFRPCAGALCGRQQRYGDPEY